MASVSTGRPPRHCPTADSLSQTSARGTAPSPLISAHARPAGPATAATGSSAPSSPASNPPPSPAPAAARPARPPAARPPAGTTDHTAPAHPADTASATPDPAARTAAAAPAPALQHRQRPLPADPLRDHRRRHVRPGRQQLPDPRLSRIGDRPLRRPLVPRRPIRGQRPPHRVPAHPQLAGNRPHRHPSARCNRRISAQSSTLITPHYQGRGPFSAAGTGTAFTRRRQRIKRKKTFRRTGSSPDLSQTAQVADSVPARETKSSTSRRRCADA